MYKEKDKIGIRSLNGGEGQIDYARLSYEDVQNLTETHLYDEPMPYELIFSIDFETKMVGEISLKSIRWFNRKAEIGIYIQQGFREKGIAGQALRLFIGYVFNTMNFHRLEAEVVDYNSSAKRLFENLGFKQEGILREAKFFNGRFHDIISYGILASEWKE